MFLTYNGINLALTAIDRVQRDRVLSDDGSTILYVEHTISVSAVYHPPTGSGIPDLSGTAIAGAKRSRVKRTTDPSTPRPSVRGNDPGTTLGGQSSLAAPVADSRKEAVGAKIQLPGWLGGTGTLQPAFTQPVASVRPILSTGANPATPTSCALPDPGSEGWAGPITTDRELELRLSVPRKKLIIWAYDSKANALVWIESPRRNAHSDAKHGPIVLGTTVRQGPNGISMYVNLHIRTWLSPCEDGSDRPILSHRWHMAHVPDDRRYLSRLTKGQVVFDIGAMEETHQQPDWFRNQMFHPIPLGFERKLGPVDLSPDGTTLTYEYVDTDVTCVFDAADTDATRMDIKEYVKYTHPWRGVS